MLQNSSETNTNNNKKQKFYQNVFGEFAEFYQYKHIESVDYKLGFSSYNIFRLLWHSNNCVKVHAVRNAPISIQY